MSKVLVDRELLPCPFCGGKPRLDQRITQSLWNSSDATFSNVTCDECDVTGQDFCDDPSGEEAIEWWNRRAQPAEAEGASIPLTGEYHIDCGYLMNLVDDQRAALSAVTAERDRLDAECGRLLEGKIQDAETIYVLEAERDQLRAEVEALRKYAEQAEQWEAACGDWRDTSLAIHGARSGYIACGIPEDKAQAIIKAHNASLPKEFSAAMAAKEA